MKVLGLSGSMRKDGNTAQLIKVILKRCEEEGIPTEFVSLAGKKISPCLGCELCKEKMWCVQEKDDWGEIMEKVVESDVLIIGSPTYYYDVCGHLKNFIDRSYSLYHDRKLAGRKGVAVAVQASKGASRNRPDDRGIPEHPRVLLPRVGQGERFRSGCNPERQRSHCKSAENRG